MTYLIKFDQQELSNYFLSYNLSTSYSALARTLNNWSIKFPASAKALARGDKSSNPYFSMNSSYVIEKFKNRLISTDKFPIRIDFGITLQSTIPFREVVKTSINKSISENANPMPLAVRSITKSGHYIIERPPFQTKVELFVNGKNKISQSVEVWIPWTLTVINPRNPNDCRIYFSHKPLSSEDDVYIPSVLPNTYASGAICFANSLATGDIYTATNSDMNIRHIYSLIFNEYMSGGWNIDLNPNIKNFIFYGMSLAPHETVMAKYNSITAKQIHDKYPRLRYSSLEKLITDYKNIDFSYSREKIFKYMFFAMSTFSLEETLKFYEEISSKNTLKKAITFNNITEECNNNQTRGYDLLQSKLVSSCDTDMSRSGDSKYFSVMFENYHESDENISYVDTSIPTQTLMEKYNDLLLKIIHNELDQNKPTSAYSYPCYIINCSKTEIIYHKIDKIKHHVKDVNDFYFQYIIDHYTTEYVSELEKVSICLPF